MPKHGKNAATNPASSSEYDEVTAMKDALVEDLKYSKVVHSGLIEVYQKTLDRKDIRTFEKVLVIKVLLAQGRVYYDTMYRRMYNTVYAQPQYLEWFKNPNCFGCTIDAKYKLPKADKRPVWVKVDIDALVEAKEELIARIEHELHEEDFSMAGIDALFDCTATYAHPVDLMSLMRAVLYLVADRLELCATVGEKKKAHINMIRKYLDTPCKTVLGKK